MCCIWVLLVRGVVLTTDAQHDEGSALQSQQWPTALLDVSDVVFIDARGPVSGHWQEKRRRSGVWNQDVACV